MKWILYANFITILLFNLSTAQASERREFYNGVRSLGMGDSSVAIVNDETALILNPAALGKLRDFYGTIFDPELELGQQALNMYNAQAYSQPFQLSSVAPAALTATGDYYHARGQLFPSFVAKNFGIGILQKYNLDLLSDATAANLETFYRDDLAVLLGYNLRFFDGRIKIGFTGKVISRIEIDEAALSATGPLDLPTLATNSIAKEGVGIGADVGLILTAPWTFLPTISAVARDVGNTTYDKMPGTRLATSTARPNPSLQDVDVGLALFPIHRKNVRSTWTIEYRNLLTASTETDKAKLIHAGLEFNFADVVFLRMGYNQRYFTGGFELSSERFQFQIATYGEEIGTATAPREDRRYAAKFGFRF